MKRIEAVAMAAIVAAAGIGCDAGAGDVEDAPEAAERTADQQELAPTTEPATGGTADAAAVALGVDTLQGAGAYLTDGQGRALYLLEGEPADSSTCYDACAREWPPLLAGAQGMPRADAAPVQENLIGTVERRTGERQVTYAGHALYYYHDDQGPGTTTGQDVTDQWGEWYLVTPSGEHLEEEGS